MMFDNRLPADRLDALAPGDTVLIENWPNGWREPSFSTAPVVRTTATQVIVAQTIRGDTVVARFRKKDAQAVGNANGRTELVDPTHPRTITGVARARRSQRQQAIDTLAHQWARNRDDLDLLRRLRDAATEYLDSDA